jgi:hypothetical protein
VLASDRRVEDLLNRLAALSPQERALVIEAAADRWGAPPDEDAAAPDGDMMAEDDDDLHAQCVDLAALKSCWSDTSVAMAVARVIGISLYASDAPKIPAPDQTSDLIATSKRWLNRLEEEVPVEAQQAHNSGIAVDGVANVEIAGRETVQD